MSSTNLQNVQKERLRVGHPTRDEAALRTQMLLEKAQEVFFEVGYQKASVDEIARRAMVTLQTLYARFPSKADLFTQVILKEIKRVQNNLPFILEPEENPQVALMKYGESVYKIFMKPASRPVTRVLLNSSWEFPKLARLFWKQSVVSLNLLTAYLKAQASKGVLAIDHPDEAARVFESLCLGDSFHRSTMHIPYPRSPVQVRHHLQEAVRIFLAAYTPDGQKVPQNPQTKKPHPCRKASSSIR